MPADALKTLVRFPKGEYKEEMRLPSAGGTGDGEQCCKCAVLGASFLCVGCCALLPASSYIYVISAMREKLRGRDTPPIHQRYRWWSGMLKGAVAATSPTGPWTDGRTGDRTSNDDERHPWRIPLDRPCLLCSVVQKWSKIDTSSPTMTHDHSTIHL